MGKIVVDKIKIQELLSRGVEEVFDKDHLEGRLLKGEKLKIKFGIDPTGSLLHLGHSLPLSKLQQFLNLGHEAVLLIGDFTATIGDPSGRLQERPPLSAEDVKNNMKEYLKQAGEILDIKKTTIKYNSEWYKKKNFDFFMDLASKFTYARLMDRAEFKERIKSGGDITMLELMYPLLQGYDSVELGADVEIGGTDQKFNLLMGRKVQKRYGLTEQDVLTLPLLVGTDGEKKMSKTYNNFIALNDSSDDMFGKTMTIPDSLIWQYFLLLTDIPEEEIRERQKLSQNNIFEQKKNLAQKITERFHGKEAALRAREEFDNVFSKKELPSEMEEVKANGPITTIIASVLNVSNSEIKRLMNEKAVSVNGEIINDWRYEVKAGDIIKVGPRRFVKII